MCEQHALSKYYYGMPLMHIIAICTTLLTGDSQVQRQRFVVHDLAMLQHGTHHCLYLLRRLNEKGLYSPSRVYYFVPFH